MDSYTQAAVERAMKVQEVMLQAMAKKITWWQAAEILGISRKTLLEKRKKYGLVPEPSQAEVSGNGNSSNTLRRGQAGGG